MDTTLSKLGLLSKNNWINGLENTWKVTKTAAKKQLLNFLDNGLNGIKTVETFPLNATFQDTTCTGERF